MCTYNQLIEGLRILAKYDPKKGDSHGVDACHDVLLTNIGDEAVSPTDRANLIKLGWHVDTEYGDNVWARAT